MTYSNYCQNLCSTLPLGARPPNTKHQNTEAYSVFTEHPCPCQMSFGTNPEPQLLKSKILRHQTVGRCSILSLFDIPLLLFSFILHINLIIPAFLPAVYLLLFCCGLCFPGWVLFSSPFGHCLMGIFLKCWTSSCHSLVCLSLVIDTLVQYCSLGTQEFTASWYCYHLGPFECSLRPPVLSGFSPGDLFLL